MYFVLATLCELLLYLGSYALVFFSYSANKLITHKKNTNGGQTWGCCLFGDEYNEMV